MTNRTHILRYLLILRKLRSTKVADFNTINNFLKIEYEIKGYDFSYSKRTFQRDINDIISIFGIEIKCNRTTNEYYIAEEDSDDLNSRLFESLDIFNAMKFSGSISKSIIFEKRKPLGTEHMFLLLHAIQNKQIISFNHQKYWEDSLTIRTVEPYSLKEFKSRWYLLAKETGKDMIKSFGLDRISNIELTKKKFKIPENFDANSPFRNSFGITNTTSLQPSEIMLSFDPEQGKYIKSLPLHESQKTLIDSDKELKISLKLCITYDFKMELLSFGDTLTVISPESLKNDIIELHKKALDNY